MSDFVKRLRSGTTPVAAHMPPRSAPEGDPILPFFILRGPAKWIQRVARLGHPALAVALAVLHQTTVERRATVRVRRGFLDTFDLDRFQLSRGLEKLEEAGLADVERAVGKRATVTLRFDDPPAAAGGAGASNEIDP